MEKNLEFLRDFPQVFKEFCDKNQESLARSLKKGKKIPRMLKVEIIKFREFEECKDPVKVGDMKEFPLSGEKCKLRIGAKSKNADFNLDLFPSENKSYLNVFVDNLIFIQENRNSVPQAKIKISSEIIVNDCIYNIQSSTLSCAISNQILELTLKDTLGSTIECYVLTQVDSGEILFNNMKYSEISIGRNASCTIIMDDQTVSNKHAIISYQSNWIIKDNNSKNGLWKHLHNTTSINNNSKSSTLRIMTSETILLHGVTFKVYLE